MSSDPHEIAAWRAFGMLGSDEAAGFDEAMRQDPELRDAYREMNLLSAAVAAVSVAPLIPRAGQLERLQARLGLQASKSVNWLGISGWAAAAAAFTVILLVDRKSPAPSESVKNSPPSHAAKRDVHLIEKATHEGLAAQPSSDVGSEPAKDATANRDVATQENDVKLMTKWETKRLVQEIAVLRKKLESVEKREQQRLEPVQGMAWPMVMTMRPPHTTTQIVPAETTDTSVVGVLGDALAGKSSLADNRAARASADLPSAVPIYDPATGAGTLVANNLSDTNLWVTAKGENQPRLLGKIPQSSEAYEAVGFELPVGTIPDNFIITNDSAGKGAPPSDKNTILIGPR
jgi:hypothetical protein